MISRRIPLKKLYNTRDLGGMETADGRRIKGGKLIRSGHLYFAGTEDVSYLSGKVSLVVDFRNRQEALEKPDPVLGEAQYVHLPIIQELVTGVTREEKSFDQIMMEMLHDPQAALQYMETIYTTFVTNEFAISQYAQFVRLLLEERSGAVLWHCTAGKDRAGFASVIVQHLLGVSRDHILEDYMMTNTWLVPEAEPLIRMIEDKVQDHSPEVDETLQILFGAREEYLLALEQAAKDRYGSFDEYLRQGLGADEEICLRLREMYLE